MNRSCPHTDGVLPRMALDHAAGGAPSTQLLTRAQAKEHLRVDHTDEDDLIDALVAAVGTRIEAYTLRSFRAQSWAWKLPDFPRYSTEALSLPRPIVRAVTNVTYLDIEGVSTVWGSGNYRVDLGQSHAFLSLDFAQTWPSVRDVALPVTITYDAGYADAADIPGDVVQAARLLLGTFYEHRESTVTGTITSEVALDAVPAVAALLAPYKKPRIG